MKKARYFHSFWHNDDWLEKNAKEKEFDYYQVDDVKPFAGTHPALMKDIIARQNRPFDVSKIVHNFSPRERFLYEVEKRTGWRIGEYKNYKLI